jgi:hypothetical protein
VGRPTAAINLPSSSWKVRWHWFRDVLSVEGWTVSKLTFSKRVISSCDFHWGFYFRFYFLVGTFELTRLCPISCSANGRTVFWPRVFYSWHDDRRGSNSGFPARF